MEGIKGGSRFKAGFFFFFLCGRKEERRKRDWSARLERIGFVASHLTFFFYFYDNEL